MKLGISYPVFDGEELLEYVLRPIRKETHFVSVIVQDVSYFGTPTSQELINTVFKLHELKLVDAIKFHDQDRSLSCKDNETNIRNVGLDLSIKAGCSHHISADVDEFYVPEQLAYAKNQMEGHDSSVIHLTNYYKRPTWRIVPEQGHQVSFIHPVETRYDKDVEFPFRIDISRKLNRSAKCRIFAKDEVVIHHMTYVRKDIRKKMENSSSFGYRQNLDKFVEAFDRYKLGDRLRIAPDQLNRKTKLVPNIFNIEESIWEQHLSAE